MSETEDYVAAHQHGEQWVYVIRMIFNHRITIGPEYSAGYYDDCWCYDTRAAALAAAAAWNPELEPEPAGWVKHPPSGRYRPGGDPAREFNQRGPA